MKSSYACFGMRCYCLIKKVMGQTSLPKKSPIYCPFHSRALGMLQSRPDSRLSIRSCHWDNLQHRQKLHYLQGHMILSSYRGSRFQHMAHCQGRCMVLTVREPIPTLQSAGLLKQLPVSSFCITPLIHLNVARSGQLMITIAYDDWDLGKMHRIFLNHSCAD